MNQVRTHNSIQGIESVKQQAIVIVEISFSSWSLQLQDIRNLAVKIWCDILVVSLTHLPTTSWVLGSASLGSYVGTGCISVPFKKYIFMCHLISLLKTQLEAYVYLAEFSLHN